MELKLGCKETVSWGGDALERSPACLREVRTEVGSVPGRW